MQFFSFAARTGRFGWVIWLVVFCAAVWVGAVALTRVEGALLVVVYALLGLAAAKLTTETVRRVHDCGQSGWIGFGACIGIVVLVASAALRWLGYGADLPFWGLMLAAMAAGAALALRPGESGTNGHGPPPGSSVTGSERPSPAGAVTAAAWVAAGMAFGFAVLSWQAGMDLQREQRMRIPEPPASTPSTAASRRTGIDAENDVLSNRIDDLLKTDNAQ